MLVPEAEQGARDGHGLPPRSTGRCWITPKRSRSGRGCYAPKGAAPSGSSELPELARSDTDSGADLPARRCPFSRKRLGFERALDDKIKEAVIAA
jgi:hypothetical protein